MNRNTLERVVLPIAIPAIGLTILLVFVFPFSRILIAVGKVPAVFVALVAATVVIVAATAIAAAPRLRSSTLNGLAVLGLVVVVAGGAWAMPRLDEGLATHAHDDHEPALETITVRAANNEFDTDLITLPAGEQAIIRFAHSDPEPHNIAIFSDDTMTEVLFRGEIISAGDRIDYEVGPFEAGTYHFHCDVHPPMDGMVVVE